MLRLEHERRKLEITKSELARRSGLNQVTVIEATNARRIPGPGQLAAMAKGLGYAGDPAELLEEVDS